MTMFDDDPEELPEAKGGHRRRFSLIWLVPISAALVAGFLGWRTLSDQGPSITIVFETGEGLEAGQTPVKHKDVNLGLVESVALSSDLKKVIVGVSMNAEAEDYLGPEAKFWVVRPRIGPSGVSGLGTLVSGAYVAMTPSRGPVTHEFVGLDQPPVLESSEPGTEYLLKANRLVSVGAGSPIFFRGIQVGEILGYDFDDKTQKITIHAFVRQPHDQLVREGTRFWNASGIALTTDGGDFRLQIESLQAVFSGGVSFETGELGKDSPLAEKDHVFNLYPNQEAATEADFTQRRKFLLYFPDSVRGLAAGAPVMLRGIKIGEVVSVRLEFDAATNKVQVPVVIEIEAGRFKIVGGTLHDLSQAPYEIANDLVRRGLRAQLQLSSIITGSMMVGLDFFPEEPETGLKEGGLYPEIPTKPTILTEVTQSATEILNKIAALPLEQLVNDLRSTIEAYGALAKSPEVKDSLKELDKTLGSVQSLMATANRDIGPVMSSLRSFLSNGSKTLERLSATLSTLEPGSPMQRDLRQAVVELRDALRSIRVLANLLEEQPGSLLRGKVDLERNFSR